MARRFSRSGTRARRAPTRRRTTSTRVRRSGTVRRAGRSVQTVRIEVVQPRPAGDPALIGLKPTAAAKRAPF